jgi:MFS family permease
VTLAFAIFNATNMGFWQVLGPVITSDTIGPKGWGLALSACGAGALLASLVLVKLPIMRRPMTPALASMSLATLPLILLGAGANLAWLMAASFVAGIVAEFFTVVWVTVTNTHIPERLLSRVGAHDEFWSLLSLPIGQISASALAAVAGNTTVAASAEPISSPPEPCARASGASPTVAQEAGGTRLACSLIDTASLASLLIQGEFSMRTTCSAGPRPSRCIRQQFRRVARRLAATSAT